MVFTFLRLFFVSFSFYFTALALQLWQLLIKICKKRSVSVALLCFVFSHTWLVLFTSRKLISALLFWSVKSEKNWDVIKDRKKPKQFCQTCLINMQMNRDKETGISLTPWEYGICKGVLKNICLCAVQLRIPH